jgi:thiol-disulfide isomerase/thioredoxin
VVLTPGQEAPSLALPDLDGDVLDLDAFRGRPLLLLFWSPGCGFCAAMLDDLRAWDADPPPGSPRLLVVSQGGREANRALGLRSPVVVEQGALLSHMAFGVRATPSAILLDADGRVATGMARGVRAVTGLMGIRRDRWEVVPVAPGTDAAPARS